MTITATHEININMITLADAFRKLLKERYPLLNENDYSNLVLITEQLKQTYEHRLHSERSQK